MNQNEKSLIDFVSLLITFSLHLLLFVFLLVYGVNFTDASVTEEKDPVVQVELIQPEKIIDHPQVKVEKSKLKQALKKQVIIPALDTKITKKEIPQVKKVSLKNAEKGQKTILTEHSLTVDKKNSNLKKLVEQKIANDTSKNNLGVKGKIEAPGAGTNANPVYLPGDSPNAKVISIAKPVYPKDALNNEWVGIVKARVTVDVNGKVKTISLIKSSGYAILDNSFIRAISKYSFKPKRIAGIPKEDELELDYSFTLN